MPALLPGDLICNVVRSHSITAQTQVRHRVNPQTVLLECLDIEVVNVQILLFSCLLATRIEMCYCNPMYSTSIITATNMYSQICSREVNKDAVWFHCDMQHTLNTLRTVLSSMSHLVFPLTHIAPTNNSAGRVFWKKR